VVVHKGLLDSLDTVEEVELEDVAIARVEDNSQNG